MKKLNGVGFLYLLLGIIIIASFTMVSGYPAKYERVNQHTNLVAVKPPPNSSHPNLQLQTFSFVTSTPTPLPTSQPQPTSSPQSTPLPTPIPTGTCSEDSQKQGGCTCLSYEYEGVICENKQSDGTCPAGGQPCSVYPPDSQQRYGCDQNACLYVNGVDTVGYFQYKDQCSNHQICWGKPVIYLYPVADTFVSVTLDIPGNVIKSDPLYNNGWFNVLAHPNGSLTYQGKQYHELFYESQVSLRPTIQSGMYVKKINLQNELTNITTKLGLLPNEQQEFLNYWLPKLNVLSSNYVFVSVLTPEEKDKVDHVTITPKPTTNLAYLFYFKPANKMENIPLLILPQSPPKRVGFTAVEWGGTIDN